MTMAELAETGVPWPQLQSRMGDLKSTDFAWREGRVPVYVYRYNEELMKVSQQAFMEFFTENALGASRAFPSVRQL